MASFRPYNNILMTQQIIEAEFNRDRMGCTAQLCYLPIYDRWEIFLDVTYLYLGTRNIVSMEHDLGKTYNSFIDIVYQIRKSIFKEFDAYFNTVWC